MIEATLKPACMNRVDVSFHAVPARPVYESIAGKKEYVFENGQMSVVVNTATGLLDSYKVEGVEYIKPASFQLRACDDTYNSWGLSGCGSYGVRNLELLTPHEGSAFSGLGDKVIPSVRVIEDGEVRTVVETLFGWHDSKAYQRYIFPKKGTSIEIETGVYWNEKDTFLKLHIGTDMEEGDYLGQVMFGREKLKQGGQEVVAQKWNCLTNGQKALAVINCGNHGSCVRNGEIGITLLRSAGYSAADGNFECTLHEERHTVRMEQGERIFRFRVMAGEHQEILDSLDKEAQIFNEVPYGFALSPSGNGQKKGTFFTIDNPAVILSACKKAERKDGYVLRVYEAAGKENNARIAFSGLDTACEVRLNPYEIKTLYFDVEKCTIKETDLLD